MKIGRAIEILEMKLNNTFWGSEEDLKDAIRLGFEAAKYVKDIRLTYDGVPLKLLPGETKD